jgi:hypothetical protein
MSCDEVRQLAPELALGIADGAERAAALRHVAVCPECRRMLDELSEVTDELLMLVPEREPPAGFESRLLARVRPPRAAPRRRQRRRTLVAALAGAAVAAGVVGAVMRGAYSDDRRLAAHYRTTLAEAHGSYFEAAELRSAAGGRAGVVFGYRGSPSWIFVVVDGGYRGERYAGELVLESGRRMALPALRIDPRNGSAGVAIDVDLHDVSSVRLAARPAVDTLAARLPHAAD